MPEPTTPQAADLAARLEAVLAERFTELGNPFSEMRRQEKGPDGWPASHPVGPHHVAEVLRELLAAVPPPAPVGRAALRDRIAAAMWERQNPGRRYADCEYRWQADAEADADAVLAVLPEPADRAPVLVDEAALIELHCPDHGPQDQDGVWMDCHCPVADDMRRRAAAPAAG